MTGGLVIAKALGECGCVNGTLAQPNISTGHRAVVEASESSAFCHPGSYYLLGCEFSVHLT